MDPKAHVHHFSSLCPKALVRIRTGTGGVVWFADPYTSIVQVQSRARVTKAVQNGRE